MNKNGYRQETRLQEQITDGSKHRLTQYEQQRETIQEFGDENENFANTTWHGTSIMPC